MLSLVVAFAFQGSRHLFDPDEGRYTNVAQNMLESGDWLVPRLDPDRPHFTKPPLTYWAVASSYAVFGRSEWSARLPNAVAFVLTSLLVLGLARRLGLASPELAAGAWITAWGPAAAANVVTTDTLLVMFETLAVFGFVLSGLVDHSTQRPRQAGLRLMWLGFGLAFLTKGPPGLLPLVAIVAFVVWRRRPQLARLFDPIGLLLFTVVGLGWFIALVWTRPDLLDYFLVHETLGRVATAEHHRNAGWFGWLAVYPPVLIAGTLPWLAIAGILGWRRRRQVPVHADIEPDVRRFLALWILIPLAIFTMAQSRLPLYILPILVPLLLALAAYVGRWQLRGRQVAVVLALAAAVAVSIKLAGSFIHADGDAHTLAEDIRKRVDLSAIHEIVFVDAPARYGLKHYLNLEVEQAETHPGAVGPAGYAPPDQICVELSEREHILLIAPARRLDDVMAHLDECPHLVERIGSLRSWILFRSLPASPVPAQESD